MTKVRAGARIDCHVHIIGDGTGKTGCRLGLRGWRRIQAMLLVRQLGLPVSVLKTGLDAVYADHLAKLVQESSIDQAVILAHDEARDRNGRVIPGFAPFYTPNEYVLSLAERYHCFLAGVSIHPAREDALEELDRGAERGAVIMKCLPLHHNIDPREDRYLPFWEKMAEKGMVLLAHTGGELSIPVLDKSLADPRILSAPLECGVTVIAAHSATNSAFDRNYYPDFLEMLERYPRLYGDNSALNSPLRSKHLKICLAAADRLVHGSDYPIPVSASWARMRGLISGAEAREANAKNPIERDVLIKQAAGYPAETFTRLSQIFTRLQRKSES